jgi:hypothetical protein
MVCIDLRRSLIAYPFGLGRTSSSESFGEQSSKEETLSRVGELAADESCDVINVGWPDDIYDSREWTSCKVSRWRTS